MGVGGVEISGVPYFFFGRFEDSVGRDRAVKADTLASPFPLLLQHNGTVLQCLKARGMALRWYMALKPSGTRAARYKTTPMCLTSPLFEAHRVVIPRMNFLGYRLMAPVKGDGIFRVVLITLQLGTC